jgi:hypothetical protein
MLSIDVPFIYDYYFFSLGRYIYLYIQDQIY